MALKEVVESTDTDVDEPEREYGKFQIYEDSEGTVVYQEVSGGKKKSFLYWLIHGISRQKAGEEGEVEITPIVSVEERNKIRIRLAPVIPGPMVFAEPPGARH